MKNSILCFIIVIITGCASLKNKPSYQTEITYKYSINLNNLKNNQLSVQLNVNGFKDDTVQFCFPKIIPGIYSAADYGKSVEKISFKDKQGNLLLNKRIDVNRWEIYGSKKLTGVSYTVNGNWEEFNHSKWTGEYYMTESSFKDSCFVINHNTIFGYFKKFEKSPFEIQVSKPGYLYAATSLKSSMTPLKDVFYARSYNQLIDNPVLYAIPDTTNITLPGINVQVACYSNSGKPMSKEIANYIRPLLINQSKYLGGKLPVSRYTFIIYHNERKDSKKVMTQGLEHANSTLILLNAPLDMAALKESVYGTASHEFFHIIMPLGIHSYEIADYDFNDPKFSRHLWLYEGMTEYFTIHMPIKNKLISLDDFIEVIENKYKAMQKYNNDISLVDFSLNSMKLDDQYLNIYQKGPLLNLCLDIRLRELSDGKFGAQDLVFALLKKYGPDKAFKDDQLFDEIVKICGYPEIGGFFERYVKGHEALPLEETLKKVGLNMKDGKITKNENLTDEQKKLRYAWINQ
ncbi:Predicted metalloprotease, contains C-terminal PDZ domain [Mucilaginibacter lappiensis]|uniref:Metalloprotease with PDZ domain n=1 Tax=Mucilaginibacter lappiensis TaxID=354630 RepID=A0ABR6PF45_9SPHI|nr:hypothetical protein [Mucilaginibacter lappiensis]MBB6107640.1 putative metalloprotease with PDZ domain [Mucilaginibacter lappiensis]SIQ01989.1 Predicted metalloprotease, contains C-terminal PDZ domain [Mucilaginibacter lappiensis]